MFTTNILGKYSVLAALVLFVATLAAETHALRTKIAGANYSTALYEETAVDMDLKTLWGNLALERQWANGRWTFNPNWADLQFMETAAEPVVAALLADTTTVPSGTSQGRGSGVSGTLVGNESGDVVKAIFRNTFAYRPNGENLDVFYNEERKIITRTESGYRWSDARGNLIDYSSEGLILRLVNRNNNSLEFIRDSNNRISSIRDQFGTALITYTFDAQGRPLTLTDYSGRTVSYTWKNNELVKVTDVRGYDWQYSYRVIEHIKVIETKTDAEGREASIKHDVIGGGSTCVDGSGGHWVENNGTWEFIFTPCTLFASSVPTVIHTGVSDTIGKLSENRFFYDGENKTYKNVSYQAGVGDISVNTNLDARETARYINGQLLFEVQISNNGRTRVHTDHNGYQTTSQYDDAENITQITYADGTSQHLTYDQFSNVLSHKNENDVLNEFSYDANGSLTRATEAKGTSAERITEFEYDALGRLSLMRQLGDDNTQEAITRWTAYDNYGNALTQIDPEGTETRYTYDALGNVLTFRDGRGHTWTNQYDAAGNLLNRSNPLTIAYEQYSYDKVGNLLTEANGLDQVVQRYTYNARNQVTSIADAYNNTRSLIYNSQSQIIEMRDENDAVTILKYDSLNRLSEVIDPLANSTRFEYGTAESGVALYGVKTIHYPTFSKKVSYDKRYRPNKVERYAGDNTLQTQSIFYDNIGNTLQGMDSENRQYQYRYDALNRIVKEISPDQAEVSFSYNDRDALIGVTNQLDIELRSYSYDLNDLRLTEVWPNNSATFRYSYDGNGNTETYTDAKNQVHRYTYDTANRLTQTDYYTSAAAANPVKTVTRHYNNADSITSYNDGTTSASYSYDLMQRSVSSTTYYGAFSRSHAYTYNPAGQKASLTYPDASADSYSYNALGVINSITTNGGTLVVNDYQWVAPKKITFPGGSVQENHYDSLMRLSTLKVQDPAKNTVMNYGYAFDAVGNITQKNTEHGNYTYTYDLLDRLLTADNPNLAEEAYTYDATGNRISSADKATPWVYNELNQLTSVDSDTYKYDANGSLTQRTLNGVTQNFIYDIENRLVEVQDATHSTIAQYSYDPFGRRLSKTVSGQTKYFYYIDEGLVSEYDAVGNIQQAYGYQPGSTWSTDPVFTKISNEYFYYLNDHLGAPQKLINSSGKEVWFAQASAFGKVSVGSASSIENPLRFPGQYFDSEKNSHYNYFRDYYPDLGRYLQSDPAGLDDGPNTYNYVQGNPIYQFDSYGLFTAFIGGLADNKYRHVKDFQEKFNDKFSGSVPSQYFQHHQKDDIIQAVVNALSQDPCQPINLVGHSLGGATANKAAKALSNRGIKVTNVVTIDPVSIRRKKSRVKPGNAHNWINVMADYSAPGGKLGNWIADAGSRWKSWPDGKANSHYTAPYNHKQFSKMFRHTPPGGTSAYKTILKTKNYSSCQCQP